MDTKRDLNRDMTIQGKETETGRNVSNKRGEWEEMMDRGREGGKGGGGRKGGKEEWTKARRTSKIFLITNSRVILNLLGDKCIHLKNSYGDCDKVTHSKVIFTWKSLLFLAGHQKVKNQKQNPPKNQAAICYNLFIIISQF